MKLTYDIVESSSKIMLGEEMFAQLKMVIKDETNRPIWDLWEVEVPHPVTFIPCPTKVVVEHGCIHQNASPDILRKFIVDKLLEKLQKCPNDFLIFLGNVYQEKKDNNAQEKFEQCYGEIQFCLEDVERKKEERKEKEIFDRAKRYGITEEECRALLTYQGSEYFISNTLLHEECLLKFMAKSPYGEFLENFDYWSNPRNAVRSYCLLYSAMCKFKKIYLGEVEVSRTCSELYREEMEKTGETVSLLSFTPSNSAINSGEYLTFDSVRTLPITLTGTIAKEVPFFDYSILIRDDWQPIEQDLTEVLIPPFMPIRYQPTSSSTGYQTYDIRIDYPESELTLEEIDSELSQMKTDFLDSDVIKRYYETCYTEWVRGSGLQNMDSCSDKALEQEFREWQKQFKKYLRLQFAKIHCEILKSHSDEISPEAIEKATAGIDLRSSIQFLKNLLFKKKDKNNERRI